MLAKERGSKVKALDNQLKRQEYLTKKNTRTADAARRSAQEAVKQLSQLKNEMKQVRSQIKAEAFVEDKQRISQLKKQARQAKESRDKWQTRYVYMTFSRYFYIVSRSYQLVLVTGVTR